MIGARAEAASFHTAADRLTVVSRAPAQILTSFGYTFTNFFHPYVEDFIQRLNRGSVFDMLATATQSQSADFFMEPAPTPAYVIPPNVPHTVTIPSPPQKTVALEREPYAIYNWELFFFTAMGIGSHFSSIGRFEGARRWYGVVLDPAATETSVWRFLPFQKDLSAGQIDAQLQLLSTPDTECTDQERLQKKAQTQAFNDIANNPFDPYAAARARPIAYQYYAVKKILDNYIAWGDSRFQQYTIESLNEATQIYLLAATLLGERPKPVPEIGLVTARSYFQLSNTPGYDGTMGNALVDLETQFPFSQTVLPQSGRGQGAGAALWGIGRTLYFCVPADDRMLAYWDVVADRLYKIRHCQNIQGVVQPLPLWDPPIDPGMLVKAAAAGIDVGSIVNGIYQPIGPLRSTALIQKALELAGDVRSLGGALLAALEKGDAEHLATVRQGHEVVLQQAIQDTRFLQWKQAEEATTTLLRTRASAVERYRSYQRLLGITQDSTAVPDTFDVSGVPELTADTFQDVYGQLVAQYDLTAPMAELPALQLAAATPSAPAGSDGALYLNATEDADLNVHTPNARLLRLGSSVVETIGGVLAMIPDMSVDFQFWGLGGHMNVFGGSQLASMMRFQSSLLNMAAMIEEGAATAASKVAGYQRRRDEWRLQYRLAARELMQLGRQLIGSLIAAQVARHEYETAQGQAQRSQEVLDLLQTKFTSEELYGWMQGELFQVHQDAYRFALDTARRAERTMKQELMRPEVDATTFVQYNYWDAGRKGLLAGEKLYQDVKRMEVAYHDNNRREYEITRHISLRQLDPLALLTLQCTGSCRLTIPEWLLDRDCAGNFMRRTKYMALSVPSVIGPYASLNCKLTLLSSSVRISASTAEPYPRKTDPNGMPIDDHRFVDYPGGQSIETSGGSQDSGTFELNLHEERSLQFEWTGAISTWQIDLPGTFRGFDYATISDVILHLRYTAREGGAELADAATDAVKTIMGQAADSRLALFYVVRSEFATEWAAFADGKADLTVQVRKEHFPYITQSGTVQPGTPMLYSYSAGDVELSKSIAPPVVTGDLNKDGFVTVALAKTGDKLADVEHAFLVVPYTF